MTSRHIIVDNETLDTSPSAVLLTIGAVAVEIEDGKVTVLSRWYRRLQWDTEHRQRDRTVSEATVDWWMEQAEAAFEEAFDNSPERLPQWLAMQSLSAWLALNPYPIWGNGSDFDNAQLQHAFNQHGLRWPYRRNRCLRSLCGLMRDLYPNTVLPEFPTDKVKHHALHDAEHEADVLAALLQTLTNKPEATHADDFAKLFYSRAYGQIVCMRGYDDEERPEIRVFNQPVDLGICQAAISFQNDETGEQLRDRAFSSFNQTMAETMVCSLHEFATKLAIEEPA